MAYAKYALYKEMEESVQIFTVRLKAFAWTHRVLKPPHLFLYKCSEGR
jgi:hypothetical protein